MFLNAGHAVTNNNQWVYNEKFRPNHFYKAGEVGRQIAIYHWLFLAFNVFCKN